MEREKEDSSDVLPPTMSLEGSGTGCQEEVGGEEEEEEEEEGPEDDKGKGETSVSRGAWDDLRGNSIINRRLTGLRKKCLVTVGRLVLLRKPTSSPSSGSNEIVGIPTTHHRHRLLASSSSAAATEAADKRCHFSP